MSSNLTVTANCSDCAAGPGDSLTTTWTTFHRRWARLRPPLRPNAEVVRAIGEAIAGRAARVLLLGVTPELADLGDETVALDASPGMITHVWPGDTLRRLAVRGDWRAMPDLGGRFSAAIGDGSLCAIDLADYAGLFAGLERVLTRGARLAIRLYETPEIGESLGDVRRAALAGEIAGFHALKWRLAMALASETGDANVSLTRIHQAFERAFPDRFALGAATGWGLETIAEIDDYAGSDGRLSFPTRTALLASLPARLANPRFVASGTYELAERCPILVADITP